MKLTGLALKRVELIDKCKSFWDAHPDPDENTEVKLTLAEQNEIKDINKELEQVELEISESKDYLGLKEQHLQRSADLDKPQRHGIPYPNGDGKGKPEAKSVGQRFTEDFQEFKDWRDALAPHGEIPQTMRVGNSPAMEFDAKALITGSSVTSAGALVRRDYAGLVELPFRPLMLRDLITIGQTGSDLIEYPRVTGYTNAAAPTAEATATSGGSGAKPESNVTLEKVTTAVKTVAHWIAASKRALSDAGQMRTLIDNFLDYGLEEELEDQIITGDGVGENFLGIQNTVGITLQAWSTNILTTTRKARTKVKVTAHANATGYLLSPLDWETIDLLQDNEGRYYYGGPSVLGTPRLWGLPVVESEAQAEGFGWCADFRTIVLWDREQATIRVTDSHSDFFVRNLVAILAELRAALGVFRPAALVRMDLTA